MDRHKAHWQPPKQSLAMYVHVPFCASRCVYCDFTISLNKHGGHQAYEEALSQELEYRLAQLPKGYYQSIHSVYFGGGTPSLMPARWFASVLERLNHAIPMAAHCEITLEANPNAVVDAPADYLAAGLNRVSIGTQSFNANELKALSRNHSAEDAIATVQAFQQAGFQRVSLDLMYGIPQQTVASWNHSLQHALALDVGHISLYGLQLETGTPLERLIQTGAPRYALPDEDTTADAYELAQETLANAGLPLYEISNASIIGEESRHNLTYWQWGHWLALGPGAHGHSQRLEGPVQTENADTVEAWQANPTGGLVKPVSSQEALENRLIFGLRTRWGIHVAQVAEASTLNEKLLLSRLNPLLKKHSTALRLEEGWLRLVPQYWATSNQVLQDVMGL
ncbi:MAG: radical SAM family heme chaperone HemW [Vampirovibrionales bacterium]|nr:radical SAM family heme chaperone HemW [Vampirovibrionales bacterium]